MDHNTVADMPSDDLIASAVRIIRGEALDRDYPSLAVMTRFYAAVAEGRGQSDKADMLMASSIAIDTDKGTHTVSDETMLCAFNSVNGASALADSAERVATAKPELRDIVEKRVRAEIEKGALRRLLGNIGHEVAVHDLVQAMRAITELGGTHSLRAVDTLRDYLFRAADIGRNTEQAKAAELCGVAMALKSTTSRVRMRDIVFTGMALRAVVRAADMLLHLPVEDYEKSKTEAVLMRQAAEAFEKISAKTQTAN